MTTLRAAALQDMPGIYRVCDETGGDNANPELIGHIYAGPYVAHELGLARVVVDDEGVCGYLLGCADTRALEAWCETSWWPLLREQYPVGSGGADAGLVELLHSPEVAPASVVEGFPAHLHIDFLPRARGRGYGRALIEWLCAELAGRGIPGVHLGVGSDNANAIQFYEHLGFAAALPDGDTLWMTRAL